MIIVTGGLGFIGSAIIWGLNKLGYEDILIVDNLKNITSQKIKNLVGLKFTGCIDKELFMSNLNESRIFSKVSHIIHMGAISSTDITDEQLVKRENFDASKSIAKFCACFDIKFIYASSAATYGDGEFGFSDDDNTTLLLKPLNLYANSKHSFDMWMLKTKIVNKVTGLKFFNVFGPNEYHKDHMTGLVYKSFQGLQNGMYIPVFKSNKEGVNDGEQQRDFIYIKDVVDIIMFLIFNENANGIFNIGTGVAHSFNELVDCVCKSMNKEKKIVFIDHENFDYQNYTCADITKLRNTGYNKKMMTIEESVDDYVINYLSKKNRTLGE